MKALIEELGGFLCESYDDDPVAFNTALAKKLRGLKRDVGAKSIRQNYRGTGGQKHRRQMWVSWKPNGSNDVWLDSGYVSFGGIISDLPSGASVRVIPGRIEYGENTVDQIYREIVTALNAWIKLDSPKAA